MIVSDNSGKFLILFGSSGASFGQPKRRHQKDKKHLGTAAGVVYSSQVCVAGAFNRAQSNLVKPFWVSQPVCGQRGKTLKEYKL
jgi:hypothetical protein